MKYLQNDLFNFGKSMICHNNYKVHINNIKEGNYPPDEIFYSVKVTQNLKDKIEQIDKNIELFIYSVEYSGYHDYYFVVGKLRSGNYIYIELIKYGEDVNVTVRTSKIWKDIWKLMNDSCKYAILNTSNYETLQFYIERPNKIVIFYL